MKLAIIYHTRTGNTKLGAEWIAEGMNRIEGAEVRVFNIDEPVDEDFVKESCGVVFGTPTYSSNMSAELRMWLQNNAGRIGLGGKMGGAFATEQYTHGGAELAIQSIQTAELVFGMLIYSSGMGQGRPIIHLGPVGINDNLEKHNGMEKSKDYFLLFGERFARMAAQLFEK